MYVPFATLVTAGAYPRISLIPIVYELRDDDLWLVGHVARGNPHAACRAYREQQLRGIVAFELRAEEVYAKAKLSQNRTAADRTRAAAMEEADLTH